MKKHILKTTIEVYSSEKDLSPQDQKLIQKSKAGLEEVIFTLQ